jgi:hypothetical protein
MPSYTSIRFPEIGDLGLKACYLCGKALSSETTPDHIIPDVLFDKGSPSKPKLPVHHDCNNQKSMEDRWFTKHIQLLSAFDSRAEDEFSVMMNKAKDEKRDVYMVGKKLRNYKLARTMFDDAIWGLELRYEGKSLLQLQISPSEAARYKKYLQTMCRGLFIRNVPFSNPSTPELIAKQYVDLELRGKGVGFMDSIKSFVDGSRDSKWGQWWDGKISYIGSRVAETPDKGYLFVQFYSQVGILAVFK